MKRVPFHVYIAWQFISQQWLGDWLYDSGVCPTYEESGNSKPNHEWELKLFYANKSITIILDSY